MVTGSAAAAASRIQKGWFSQHVAGLAFGESGLNPWTPGGAFAGLAVFWMLMYNGGIHPMGNAPSPGHQSEST